MRTAAVPIFEIDEAAPNDAVAVIDPITSRSTT